MKKVLLLIFLCGAYAMTSAQTPQRVVCDETCKTESGATAVIGDGFAVVSPVGRGTVQMIEMAPRLSTLEGKTIAIVGGSFMARVTHPELKKLILNNYPTARIILLDEIGSAGVYPAPGVTRRSKEEFQEKLRAMGVDAVISGNCGCGLCTPKEVGSCIAAEYIGIPAVAIAGPTFTEQVFYTSVNNGVPAPRVAEYPGAFASHKTDELIKNTREILFPQIVKALTTPITAEELARSAKKNEGGLRDDIFYGTFQEVNDHFREMNWSDGLPIVPPTFEKVSEFLRYTDMKWDETVAVLPVAHRNTTVWHVAVNGVMAGCKPEYMPILIAMTKAMGAGSFRRTLASTHAWVPYSWLNGPVARQLGIDCGQGEINEAANASIGRFMNLALMNLAGYYIKQNRMGTFGYPMPWCLVEDEVACREIGWKPYHARLGYQMNDNTITTCSTLLWGNNMAPSTTNPQKIMELLAWDITERCQFALGSGKQFTYRTILMTQPIAKNLSAKYRTPYALEQDLIRTARRSLNERVFANYYANPGSNPEERHPIRNWRGHLTRTEGAATTPTPVWYDTPETEMLTIPTMKEDMTAFLITGDSSRNKVQTMPGGGFETVAIELPAEWDKLMQEKGYRPISEFYIK
ncbi:MAG: hypothetical protein IKC78_00845 [Alistipes sp.]|nr:hypothetical protein [Alistipes sp.]